MGVLVSDMISRLLKQSFATNSSAMTLIFVCVCEDFRKFACILILI